MNCLRGAVVPGSKYSHPGSFRWPVREPIEGFWSSSERHNAAIHPSDPRHPLGQRFHSLRRYLQLHGNKHPRRWRQSLSADCKPRRASHCDVSLARSLCRAEPGQWFANTEAFIPLHHASMHTPSLHRAIPFLDIRIHTVMYRWVCHAKQKLVLVGKKWSSAWHNTKPDRANFAGTSPREINPLTDYKLKKDGPSVSATLRTMFYLLPRLLIVHLSRFTYTALGNSKVHKHIHFGSKLM